MILNFIFATLVIWRITYMWQQENLPFNVGNRIRDRLGIQPWHNNAGEKPGTWQDLLSCFKCLSFWVALPFAIWLVDGVLAVFVMMIALNAAAIIVNQLAKRYLEL